MPTENETPAVDAASTAPQVEAAQDPIDEKPALEDDALSASGVDEDDDLGEDGVGPQELVDPDLLIPAIEALLFVSDKPIRVPQICNSLRAEFEELRAPSVRAALLELQLRYQDPNRRIGRGFELVEVDKGFVFRSHPDHASFLQHFTEHKPQKLSRAAMETLSVVAYRQPATRPQVDEVRGVDSSSALRLLLDRGLVRVLGKSEEVGRPLLYGTTSEFLELFGLKSLSHLPTLQEYQELDPENQAKVEEQHGKPAVQVADLVTEDQHLVSDETEADSSGALQDLENAVELADSHRKAVEESLKPAPEPAPSTAEGAENINSGKVDIDTEVESAQPSQDHLHGD